MLQQAQTARGFGALPRTAPFWQLCGSALLGFGAIFAVAATRGMVRFLIVLLLPAIAAAVLIAIRQGVRNLAVAVRRFTLWHALLLFLFLSELTFRQRSDIDIRETPVDAAAGLRVVLVVITAAVLIVRLALKRPTWVRSLFRGVLGALALYAVICTVSTLWSVYPAWTLYRSLEYLVDLALLAAVVAVAQSTAAYRALFNWTWTLYGMLLVNVWLGALLWPDLAFLPPDRGVTLFRLCGVLPNIDQNSVGEYGAILGVVALTRLLTGKTSKSQCVWYCLLAVTALVTLVFSQTRSALGGLLLGVFLVVFFSKGKTIAACLASVGAVTLLIEPARAALWEVIRRGQTPEEFQAASGRVEWWSYAWSEILKHPLLGSGAYGMRFGVMAKLGEGATSSALNTYIDVLYGVGIMGLVPVLIALFGTWWFLIRQLRDSSSDYAMWRLSLEAVGVLSVVSVRSIFTVHLIWHASLQFLIVLGYAEFLRRQRIRRN